MPDSQPADDVDPVRFVWTCLRVHRDVQAVREAVDAIERGLDWLPVANYALAHKVIPQLYRGLQCLPVDAVPNALLTQFAVLQADIEAFNSRKTGALGTVATAFADAGITGVAYKGPVVALTAYGSLATSAQVLFGLATSAPSLTTSAARALYQSAGVKANSAPFRSEAKTIPS